MPFRQQKPVWRFLGNSWPAFLVLALGMYFYVINVLGIDFAYFPGDLGDARLNMYFLEHSYRFFTGGIDWFWGAPFMHPEPNVMSYSDTLVGSAPIYSLFRLFGFDVYSSFQWWFAALSALNFIAAYIFLNYVFKNRYAAVLGAFVFAFSIGIQTQLYHAQTFARFAIPIALLMAVKFKEELHPKYFFLTLLVVVYQIYCGIYLGFMLVVPTGVLLLLGLIKGYVEGENLLKRWKWYAFMLVSAVSNLIILWPLMSPYTKRAIPPSHEHYLSIFNTIPSLKSYLSSNSGSFLWEYLLNMKMYIGIPGSHQLFTGGIATVCMMVGFIWVVFHFFRSKFRIPSFSTALLILLTGLITFLLFLRIGEVSAYLALYYIPGFTSMRLLTRSINIQLLFFAFSVAFVFSGILKPNGKRNTIYFLLALGLLIVDNAFQAEETFRWSKSEAKERVTRLDGVLAKIPDGGVFSYEPADWEGSPVNYHLDAMLASQRHNLKTVNGYTASSPIEFSFFWRNPVASNRNFWLSHHNLTFDSLYVLDGSGNLQTVTPSEIKSTMNDATQYDYSVRQMMRVIMADRDWMKTIQEKAKKQQIPVDSMIVLDAIWMVENSEE